MSIIEDFRSAMVQPAPIAETPAGPDPLSGQTRDAIQDRSAAEGQDSPQATAGSAPTSGAPAGSSASRSHSRCDTQTDIAAADNFPGGQRSNGTRRASAAGDQAPVRAKRPSAPNKDAPVRDQVPPAAMLSAPPNDLSLLADPLLALSADVLGDLEKVRIANENRLRQLTRSAEDSDGETRGFGLDEAHPDVARLAALVGMLAEAEHKATLNLQRVMRKHPLGPWVAAQKGIGEKQGARLLAAIGDPYIRPEITREDGAVEPSRPRLVSELWAYCGYHVVPADHWTGDSQTTTVGGDLNGSGPGRTVSDSHHSGAGVAPKRQRGAHANWSATAKMRAFLVAESCIKQSGTPYRAKYDETRAKYADALHAVECIRCGPKGKPAPVGSALSDGHKHARALRAVAKEVLRDLWREARRIHEETSAGSHPLREPQNETAASGDKLPPTRDETTSMSAPSAELT